VIIPIFEKLFSMLCLLSNTNDPYFNLATEEYLLRNHKDDFFFLWTSKPAAIVGKHQNTLAEINTRFVYDHNILVARRLSGGGAVYHDQGNLNFTFITNEESDKLIDFKRYALPVIGFLEELGIKATLGTKNEILSGGLKISGNAGHVYKNRVLHHGTLLFNADLRHLRSALSDNSTRYRSRAVKSNRAQVGNIADVLNRHMLIEDFACLLLDYISQRYRGENYNLSPVVTAWIKKLTTEKYAGWEWIYGYSPEYRFENEFQWENHDIRVTFTGQKGIIRDFIIQTALFPNDVCTHIAGILDGCHHTWGDMLPVVRELKLPGISVEKTADFFMTNLF
jgi:lipoate-protein ligase A